LKTGKPFRLAVLLGGLILLLTVGIIVAGAAPNRQGDPPNLDAEYKGSNYCNLCHTQEETWHETGHAQMVKAGTPENIQGDLSDVASVTITWPDGSERPVTADDITYVLGGRYVEQYVSVLERADGSLGYYVLPLAWNVPQEEGQRGAWTVEDGTAWQEPERDWRVACAGCHTTTALVGHTWGRRGRLRRR